MFAAVPRPLFDDPTSTLLYSADGRLLGARIASDGQWRFPPGDYLPGKFTACLLTYEDKRFFSHPGVDPAAVLRAVRDNFRSQTVVSGGSTVTMQLARIARGNRDRNLRHKAMESLWAVYLETVYSKKKILALYASNAPFGGNVVGVETAAWRYFGRSASELSWAESATLAVLPNSPALIHPGRNRDALRVKRDALLLRLLQAGVIDPVDYELALDEPLPEAPVPLPDEAPHLTERLAKGRRGERITTTIDYHLQRQAAHLANRYAAENASNHIYNIAAVVADAATGEVLAYVGNATHGLSADNAPDVDIVISRRSTGSILKPMLYAAMLTDGQILPNTLVADTPLNINGFQPRNYNRTFYGSVPASSAITRSLNVPLVRMLSQYNTGRFMSLLKNWGMTTLDFSEDHYGASIILGGAEGTLWDLAGIYASMSRVLTAHDKYGGKYNPGDIFPLTAIPRPPDSKPVLHGSDNRLKEKSSMSYAGLWFAFEAMSGLNRPEEEAEWQQFATMRRVAWKTGTSYGGRDGWAIGVTPDYVVGVWVGNASGEGRPGLTGVGSAAPLMFDLFSLLPSRRGWYEMPEGELEPLAVCLRSGHKAGSACEPVDTVLVPRTGMNTSLCPYHRIVHLSPDGVYRVNSSCEEVGDMVTGKWFVLPPSQEYYYRRHNADYALLPPYKPGCIAPAQRIIEVIYPEPN
ncbi:MAG: penicillin-binding protein 1C [Rikenellaceae bacterium]|nr:penicillin-binding protein 1C [Rikenellaceae bacterium]